MIKKFENFKDNKEEKVECEYCTWEWLIDPNDDRPHWCHNCSYDNSDGQFYYDELEEWREKNNKNDEYRIDEKIDINKNFGDYNFNYPHVSVAQMIIDTLNRFDLELDIYEGFANIVITLDNGVEIHVKGTNRLEIKIVKDFEDYRGGEILRLDSNLKEFIQTLGKYYPLAINSFKKMNESKPYEEKVIGKTVIRTFKQDTDSDEYVWHRDHEDRIVESIGDTDWKVQMDNEVPKSLTKKVFIPKNTYHRVIKGTGDLKVKIRKL